MDEIVIFLKGEAIFSFFETSLMVCGCEDFALFDEAEKILPAFVWDSFLKWHKNSNWDGDNETKSIKHGNYEYRFINWYWD